MMSAMESASTVNARPAPDGSRFARSAPGALTLSAYAAAVVAKLRDLAPYALIELVLPGGSVMALLLWLYRGRKTTWVATGASPYVGDGMAVSRRQSPSSSAIKITAPTLIMCDTGDYRVPITQSFGLYRALVDNHVKTEFYQRWVNWLVTYLK